MIQIAYFGDDSGFFKGLSRYLESVSNSIVTMKMVWIRSDEYMFTYNASKDEMKSEKLSNSINLMIYDLVLVASEYLALIANYTYDAEKCILLTEALGENSRLTSNLIGSQSAPDEAKWNRLSKYTPADEMVKHIHSCLTGAGNVSKTKHMIIGASFSTERTNGFALELCKKLIRQGDAVLLIGFDAVDTLERGAVESLRDPIGSLAYYALEGSAALKQSIERCTQKTTTGIDCIVRKVPFDMSQWTPQMIESLLEYFDTQVRYDAVVWVMGHSYTKGLITVFDSADQIIWFGHKTSLEEDAYFGVYASSATHRLDLKTQYIKSDMLFSEELFDEDVDRALWRLKEASSKGVGV